MGLVYRATHVALDRPVAIKLIASELAEEPGFRERFQHESRVAGGIDHPHVIPVYHAGEEDGVLFITMRLIEGSDLKALIESDGRLAPRRAARIVSQVAGALDAAHARGLVHRDVKPANVLIADAGESEVVYLTDFGLTKRTSSLKGFTRTGEIVGTLDYIAPEQIRGDPVDARTDVYALGCLLFHLITGQVPFPNDVYAAKVYAHLTSPAPDVTSVVPSAGAGLDAVVRRAMSKDPEERFQTAGELGAAAVAAIEEASPPAGVGAADATTAARPIPGSRPLPSSADEISPSAEPGLRRPRVAGLALALLVAVAAAFGGLLASGSSDSPKLSADKMRTTLDSYQASLTNGDIGALERVLAPNFTRKLLAGKPTGRTQSIAAYRASFKFRGSSPRYALSSVQLSPADGTASAHYSFTGEQRAHLGDYGFNRFHMVEHNGQVQIDRVETFPDVIAFLPPNLKPSAFPVTVELTATIDAGGRKVTIASGTTRLARAPDAIDLPLNSAGRGLLHAGEQFVARTTVQLADGRRLPQQSYTGHFALTIAGKGSA
jgi:serine/threonine protein kinase